jgi:hypothetical protein
MTAPNTACHYSIVLESPHWRLIHRNSVCGADSRNEILLAKPCANIGRICVGGDNAGTTDYCCRIRRVYGWISSFSRVYSHGNDRLAGTIFYTFLPCFLFVFVAAPWIAKSGESQLVRSVLNLIPAAAVAVILQLTVFLARGVLFPAGSSSPDLWAAGWIICQFLLIHRNSRMSHNADRFSGFERNCTQ